MLWREGGWLVGEDEREAPKKLKYSRWKRVPGVRKVGEERIIDPRDERQRLCLYVPGRLLDLAGELAQAGGAKSVQDYCETLLRQSLLTEQAKRRLSSHGEMRGLLAGIDAVAAELHGESSEEEDEGLEVEVEERVEEEGSGGGPGGLVEAEVNLTAGSELESTRSLRLTGEAEAANDEVAVDVVLSHAGLSGEVSEGFLPRLRRGEALGGEEVEELIEAIQRLEKRWMDLERIDRRVAFALHRLAFEGQLLVSEGWPALGQDARTVSLLRAVQEAVDRVLSGEDIRYGGPGEG